MNTNKSCMAAAVLIAVSPLLAADIGTAFTYQGSLIKDGSPVTDTCDFRFGLWDAAARGNQKGNSPQTKTDVSVSRGVFTVDDLDFGPGAIDGTARWLAIEIQCPDDDSFIPLSPRVKLNLAPHAFAQGSDYTVSNVAFEGDSAPGTGGGTYSSFGGNSDWGSSVNSTGVVAFFAIVTGGNIDRGIFKDSAGVDSAVVLKGDTAPGTGGGTYSTFGLNLNEDVNAVAINDSEEVAFGAFVTGGTVSKGIFKNSGGVDFAVALPGDVAPGTGGGTYSTFGATYPSLNASGAVAFYSHVSGGTSDRGMFVDTGGVDAAAAVSADAAPGTGGGAYSSFGVSGTGPSINDFGEVVFYSFVTGGSTDQGYFVDESGTDRAAALAGDTVPGTGGGTYSNFAVIRFPVPSINNSGDAVFYGSVTGGSITGGGIFVHSNGTDAACNDVIRVVALDGDVAPQSGGGVFTNFRTDPRINTFGEVAFVGIIDDGASRGVFVESCGTVKAVALTGDTAPGAGGGTFTFFDSAPSINSAGQVAFHADTSSGQGIFLASPTGDANADCNSNGVLDACDIATGSSLDVSPPIGVPDECESPSPDPTGIAKNRVVSVGFPASSAGLQLAIRVTLVTLYDTNSCPPRTAPLGDLSAFEGEVRWAGPATSYSDAPDPNFLASALQCAPLFADWDETMLLHLYGPEVVPCSLYAVQLVDSSCPDLNDESCYSPALVVRTADYGDVTHDPWPDQPSMIDMVTVWKKFQQLIGSRKKVETKIRGNLINFSAFVNFPDLSRVADAFEGRSYAEIGPSTCGAPTFACGNGIIEPGEQCDDGDTSAGDGCDGECQTEPVCGNGNRENSEECDDGNTSPGDGCDANCRIEPVCGNSTRETGEQCDDGNTTPGDGCSTACRYELTAGEVMVVPISASGPHVINGNAILLASGGQQVQFELHVRNWDIDLSGTPKIGLMQAQIDSTGFDNGMGGILVPAVVPCASTPDCESSLGIGSMCGDAPTPPGRCEPGFINHTHADHLFGSGAGGAWIVDLSIADYRFGLLPIGGPVATDDGTTEYFGTLALDVPADAEGTYTIGFLPENTFLVDELDRVFGPAALTPGVIALPPTSPMKGTDDECEGGGQAGQPCSLNSECPGGFCGMKNRYISITPQNAGQQTVIQITALILPPSLSAFVGDAWHLDAPAVVNENPAPGPTLKVAVLDCDSGPGGFDAHVRDWGAEGLVHITGAIIVPGATYEVRQCITVGGFCSAPLVVGTNKHGDVVAPLVTLQPNFGDIAAMVDKFQAKPGAISKSRAQMQPNVPNPANNVNFLDIAVVVGAFQGQLYSFPQRSVRDAWQGRAEVIIRRSG